MTCKTVYECKLENGNNVILSSKIISEREMIALYADEGKLITDGEYVGKSTIVTEENADKFYEIEDAEA